MAISTNSIIHYTDDLKKLESILREGLAIKYCAETLIMGEDASSLAAHPMISFCDIPLSQSYKHFNAYGRYGIGLTKSWANLNGVNPVLYLDSNSSISRTLNNLIIERRKTKSNLTDSQKMDILRIKCFAKNYSGRLKRKAVDKTNYRFYDEREWRLVPEAKELESSPFSVSLKIYDADKNKYNDAIKDIRFTFESKDVAYIIVDKTDEIPKVINTIRACYSAKCTAQELDILFSKICSTEQITDDY